eukprot:g64659.t1
MIFHFDCSQILKDFSGTQNHIIIHPNNVAASPFFLPAFLHVPFLHVPSMPFVSKKPSPSQLEPSWLLFLWASRAFCKHETVLQQFLQTVLSFASVLLVCFERPSYNPKYFASLVKLPYDLLMPGWEDLAQKAGHDLAQKDH